jgi:TPR repeat protein
MPKPQPQQSRKAKANDLMLQAHEHWDKGKLRSAFRLFHTAAEAGNVYAQTSVGYFYDTGIGTRPDRSEALYWYKRAYRRGDCCAANNIGTIWRDAKNDKRALAWFQKAVRLGDDGSNIEIAKIYLRNEDDPKTAIGFLNKVCKSQNVCENDVEEASALLKAVKAKLSGTGSTTRGRSRKFNS